MNYNSEIMVSIKPKWCNLIRVHHKQDEIRRSKPPMENMPAKVYVYQTENGGVIGEFTLSRVVCMQAYIDNCGVKHLTNTFGIRSCVPDEELFNYIYNNKKQKLDSDSPYPEAWAWHIDEWREYPKPIPLKEFGLKRPPQSWCYIRR